MILGVSGGPDSMCLLYVLNEIYGKDITLHVVQVNHSIRESADSEAEFVVETCRSLGVSCQSVKVDVLGYARNYGLSTEEAGRILRYQIFNKAYNEIDVPDTDKSIAVAHNMNDNAETMLLNIFRGSALGGLVGIRPTRDNIIRPLLGVSRKEIEQYLDERNLSYCIDESNMTDDYARNRVRHHIIPVAEEAINSGAVRNMMELSDKVGSAKDYIDSQVNAAYKLCCVSEETGEVRILETPYKELHTFLKQSLLYKVFGQVAGALKDVESKHIDILASVFEMNTSKKVDLPYGVEAVKTYDSIIVRKAGATKLTAVNGVSLNYRVIAYKPGDSIPSDDYTKWFDYDKIKEKPELRTRKSGDYLIINDEGNVKKLKDYFINEKIPNEKRDDMLLLADGSHIIWVIGKRISAYYKVTDETKTILEVTLKTDEIKE